VRNVAEKWESMMEVKCDVEAEIGMLKARNEELEAEVKVLRGRVRALEARNEAQVRRANDAWQTDPGDFGVCTEACGGVRRHESMPGILNTEEPGVMAQAERDFCTGVEEREKHCGCMLVSECAALAVKLVHSYGKKVPACIGRPYAAYMRNPSHENEVVLCEAVYSHINPELLAFMREYQKYLKKNDVHELLDRLSQSITETFTS
jgi:FtsZ-binding cell division protein ZapB